MASEQVNVYIVDPVFGGLINIDDVRAMRPGLLPPPNFVPFVGGAAAAGVNPEDEEDMEEVPDEAAIERDIANVMEEIRAVEAAWREEGQPQPEMAHDEELQPIMSIPLDLGDHEPPLEVPPYNPQALFVKRTFGVARRHMTGR